MARMADARDGAMTISLVTVADASTLTSCRLAINKVFPYKMAELRRVSAASYRSTSVVKLQPGMCGGRTDANGTTRR